MNSKKEFGEGLVFTISNYLLWIFLGNFYFTLLNLPLTILMFCLLTGIIINPAPWFIALCCIPMGPALTFFILQTEMYSLCIISRFYLKMSAIFRISCAYTILYFKTSLMNLCILITTAYIFYMQPILSILFLMSLFCYCLMYNTNKILKNIEESLLPPD